MAGKTFEIAFHIAGQLQKSFEKSFSEADKNLLKFNAALKNSQARSAKYQKTMQTSFNTVRSVMNFAQPAAEFEAAMSKVGAISGASGEELAAMTSKAMELGRRTQFTAKQSADAMSYLGMAGWKAGEIIAGMPGLLALAAAGGTDLARTADIVSDNLTAFGLTAQDAAHMADVYATVITNTNTNVEMLGETMKFAAPIANAFGLSMEETAAMAGILANSGIKASMAGTTLRAGLLRLSGPTSTSKKVMDELGLSLSDVTKQQNEAANALKDLGISMSDASGPKKMSQILTELREKTKALGDEELVSNLQKIFGSQAATGWVTLIKSADGEFQSLTEKLDACSGAADRMAATMTDNAQGAMTRLESAMESMQISAGNGLLPTLADFADKGAAVASWAASLAEKYPQVTASVLKGTLAFSGAAGAINGVAWALMSSKSAILKVRIAATSIYKALKSWKVMTKLVAAGQWALNAAMNANPIGVAIAGIAALVAAGWWLYKNWDKVTASCGAAWEWVTVKLRAVSDWFGEKWAAITQPVGEFAALVSEKLAGAWQAALSASQAAGEWLSSHWDAAVQPVRDFITWLLEKWEVVCGKVAEFGRAIANLPVVNWFGGSGEARTNTARAVQQATEKAPQQRTADDWALWQLGGIVPGYASGGVVTRPQLATIGERGTEYVIPAERTPEARALAMSAARSTGARSTIADTKLPNGLFSQVMGLVSQYFTYNALLTAMGGKAVRAMLGGVLMTAVEGAWGALANRREDATIKMPEMRGASNAPHVEINYAPVFNISGNADDIEERLTQILQGHISQLEERLKGEIGYTSPRLSFA